MREYTAVKFERDIKASFMSDVVKGVAERLDKVMKTLKFEGMEVTDKNKSANLPGKYSLGHWEDDVELSVAMESEDFKLSKKLGKMFTDKFDKKIIRVAEDRANKLKMSVEVDRSVNLDFVSYTFTFKLK